ncbi:hypothetical protein PVL29_018017 [Vitis rotundifolia]|uniref:Uncharacterized protein n=1 Tax=Vitis rotundifolia TaxID=103349 RepID=A0AA39DFB0_VITRO|nr:hypothetical protein PVL29_018017 [Vitis rotundifolia]
MSNVLRCHQIYFVELDLHLLENQLPFGVLMLIFEGANFKAGLPMEKKKRIRQSQPEQEQQPEKKGKSSSRQGGDGGSCCPW